MNRPCPGCNKEAMDDDELVTPLVTVAVFFGSGSALAGQRFAKLTPAAKHAWLAQHLAALQAGRISLAQLP